MKFYVENMLTGVREHIDLLGKRLIAEDPNGGRIEIEKRGDELEIRAIEPSDLRVRPISANNVALYIEHDVIKIAR